MAIWRRYGARGAALPRLALTAALLITNIGPAEAGLFSWLGGNNQNNNGEQPASRGLFGGHGGNPGPFSGGGQYAAPQPGSGAFHGDELPPAEGNEATRQWITNPALGSPTLSTRNIEATKAAIQRYQAIVAQGGWPTVPAYAMRPGSHGESVEVAAPAS